MDDAEEGQEYRDKKSSWKDRNANQLVSQRQTAGRNFKPLLYLTADISRLASAF